jgi:hypothetical protein
MGRTPLAGPPPGHQTAHVLNRQRIPDQRLGGLNSEVLQPKPCGPGGLVKMRRGLQAELPSPGAASAGQHQPRARRQRWHHDWPLASS